MRVKRTIQIGPIILRQLSDSTWLAKYSRLNHAVSCFAPNQEDAVKNLRNFAGVSRKWKLQHDISLEAR